MKRNLTLFGLAAMLALATAGSAQAPPPKPLVVAKAPLECLVKQIDKQRLGKRRTMRVRVRDCNIVDVSQAAETPPDRYYRGLPVETVLVLDAGRIACIKRNRNRIEKFATQSGDYYLIDLKSCRAPSA